MRRERLREEAERFIRACGGELGWSREATESRVRDVREAIASAGRYEHTAEELRHGARMAWRNSNRCIGRLFWETLEVRDARHLDTEEAIFESLLGHIEYATNGGKVRPAITVFPADRSPEERVRLWNYQLIRYAGYETEHGIVGDPDSVAMTNVCRKLGWSGEGTAFDVLPLVVQVGGREPKLFPIPRELVLEVPIAHPELAGFAELGLKWYAVPIVSNMRLDIGGVSYSAAPFNGWYMGTEIAARNFADAGRYDMLPRVASLMGLDTSRESSLWRDRALVELNIAVLHSYKRQGVSIVDHHTAARQFVQFEERERTCGRDVTGEWTWLIPPVSPAATPVFHRHYDNRTVTPNFFYPDEAAPPESRTCPFSAGAAATS
ncbi:nitric oxide synthase oxygenase [Paenibacillus flagellatus]|uniref:Nitric oxide synthase oxygenase n=1 Tax=Paenibacillus flagellatus TaxID=2211139 RepID=A0A2V5KLG3_9BACL|nr:nitric oxide synthase oxygenase [Paenibacillus flagellatus]PYI51647.1 nitric oxide synthase [Paenibacillus flagellatus]